MWAYQNTNYFLLGRLIETVSGKTYEEFLSLRIFTPLKMNNTELLDYRKVVTNRANGYVWHQGTFLNAGSINPATEFASGGILSSVKDLSKWDAAMQSNTIFRRSMLEAMWTPARLSNGTTVASYGLGFGLTPFKGKRRLGHTGSCPGFATAYQHFLDAKVTVIFLTNAGQKDGFIGLLSNEIASLFLSK